MKALGYTRRPKIGVRSLAESVPPSDVAIVTPYLRSLPGFATMNRAGAICEAMESTKNVLSKTLAVMSSLGTQARGSVPSSGLLRGMPIHIRSMQHISPWPSPCNVLMSRCWRRPATLRRDLLCLVALSATICLVFEFFRHAWAVSLSLSLSTVLYNGQQHITRSVTVWAPGRATLSQFLWSGTQNLLSGSGRFSGLQVRRSHSSYSLHSLGDQFGTCFCNNY